MKAVVQKINKETIYTLALRVEVGERADGFKSVQYYPSKYQIVSIICRRGKIDVEIRHETNTPPSGEAVELPDWVLSDTSVKAVIAKYKEELVRNCKRAATYAAETQEEGEYTLTEKGNSWTVIDKPANLWLEWASGSVWWNPQIPAVTPEWASALRGTWDTSFI